MLTESEMAYEDMKQAEAKGYLCGKCQGRLVVAWSGEKNCYILRCGNDINHTGITRHDIKYEKRKKEIVSMDSTALTTMNETQMMERVEMARFPQEMTKADKHLLAQVAITYGFDPLMSEVTIYQGKPFVSIDGRYRKAQETGQLDGVETRPANKAERDTWEIPDGDYFFRSEVYVRNATHPFVGWGRVYHAETVGGKGFKPVEKNPQRMAEKRAEAQALRKAFHIPLPSIEDIGSPDYDIESTARVVDKSTGEIIEKPPKQIAKPTVKKTIEPEVDPEKATETSQEAVTSKSEPPIEEGDINVLIDLDWLKEQMDLLESKGITAYSRANVLAYLNKITGQDDKKVSDAVKRLTKLQAENFTKKIQDAVEMS